MFSGSNPTIDQICCPFPLPPRSVQTRHKLRMALSGHVNVIEAVLRVWTNGEKHMFITGIVKIVLSIYYKFPTSQYQRRIPFVTCGFLLGNVNTHLGDPRDTIITVLLSRSNRILFQISPCHPTTLFPSKFARKTTRRA